MEIALQKGIVYSWDSSLYLVNCRGHCTDIPHLSVRHSWEEVLLAVLSGSFVALKRAMKYIRCVVGSTFCRTCALKFRMLYCMGIG